MNNDRRSGRRDLCADIREDDGIDPREDRRAAARGSRQPSWKDDQVATLVRRAVDDYLASSSDDFAWTLRVSDVRVEARGTSLRVQIEWTGPELYGVVQRWLDQHAGAIRAAVSLTVRRKRAPSVRLVAGGPRVNGPETPANQETDQ